MAGREVLFSGIRIPGTSQATLAFAWDFGDGTSGTGPTPTHAYRAPGTYAATVLATDGKGAASAATTSVIVRPSPSPADNSAPTATANGPYSGAVGSEVVFSASGTQDPEGDPLTFAWTFGDGTTATGDSVRHVYRHAGTYTVTLLVVDDKGAASTVTSAAVVTELSTRAENQAPVVSLVVPPRGLVGSPLTFDASATSDPDGDPLAFVWTFDDGGSAAGPRPEHVYRTFGRYRVTVLASDPHGATTTRSASVQVGATAGNASPVAVTGGPYYGAVGVPLLFDAGASRDPDGDELMFRWDFGDGTTGEGRAATHTYAMEGTFVVTLLVSDDNGGATAADTTAAVSLLSGPANAVPIARAGGPYAGTVGKPVAFDAARSSDADADALAFAWSFGDGTSSTGPSASHTYESEGTYTVLCLVVDAKGGSALATTLVTISR